MVPVSSSTSILPTQNPSTLILIPILSTLIPLTLILLIRTPSTLILPTPTPFQRVVHHL